MTLQSLVNQSLGTRSSRRLFLAPQFFLTLWTRGSVAEEYLIPPDNLRGRDDRSLLLRVWQEHANCCLSLCRKWNCRERTSSKSSCKKKAYSLKTQEYWDFISFHLSIFIICMMLTLECKLGQSKIQNPRMIWVGRDLTSLPRAGIPSTALACYKPHPACLQTLLGMGNVLQLLQQCAEL